MCAWTRDSLCCVCAFVGASSSSPSASVPATCPSLCVRLAWTAPGWRKTHGQNGGLNCSGSGGVGLAASPRLALIMTSLASTDLSRPPRACVVVSLGLCGAGLWVCVGLGDDTRTRPRCLLAVDACLTCFWAVVSFLRPLSLYQTGQSFLEWEESEMENYGLIIKDFIFTFSYKFSIDFNHKVQLRFFFK